MKTTAYIYLWVNNVNGKGYVGRGTGRRAKQHQNAKGSKASRLTHAMRKYGAENFTLTYLEQGLTKPEAILRERHYIAALGTKQPAGYNMTDGGEGAATDRKTRESTIALLRAKALARPPGYYEASRAANIGRAVSAETRARMSANRKPGPTAKSGVPLTPEHRANLTAAQRRRGASSYARGENAGQTKLTDAKVLEIRRRRRAGEALKALAAEFGVAPETICAIDKRRSWQHLPDEIAIDPCSLVAVH